MQISFVKKYKQPGLSGWSRPRTIGKNKWGEKEIERQMDQEK